MESIRCEGVEGGSTCRHLHSYLGCWPGPRLDKPLFLSRVAECRDTPKRSHGTRRRQLPLGRNGHAVLRGKVGRLGSTGQRESIVATLSSVTSAMLHGREVYDPPSANLARALKGPCPRFKDMLVLGDSDFWLVRA